MNLTYNQIQMLLRLIDKEIGNDEDNAYRYLHFGTTNEDTETARFILTKIEEWRIIKKGLTS